MYNKKGFTLVEIIVSSVIFAIAVIGLLSVFVSGNNQIIHIRERMTSAELGKFFLDPLQVYVRQDTWDSILLGNELRLGTRAGVLSPQIINNRSFSETHTVDPMAGTDIRRVITTIFWTEPSF